LQLVAGNTVVLLVGVNKPAKEGILEAIGKRRKLVEKATY
jgi:hypothetical protein